jgi:UDP-glucose 4-epimerase
MKCLVLGGGGFIGSHVVDRLLDAGHEVRIFERPRIPRYRVFPAGRVEWIDGDFQNAALVREALDGIETVLHLVSTTLPKGSNDDPAFDVQSNVVGSLRLFELAVEAGVRRTVFISSGGTVYGLPMGTPIAESHPTDPRVSYGITKLAIEKYLAVFHARHGMEYVVLRVANPYGERQRVDTAQGAIAVFIDRAIRRQAIEIWGDGSIMRDYVHVDDVAQAFVRAVDGEVSSGVFNIGSGVGHSLNDILVEIGAMLGRSVERRYLPGRDIDVPSNVLDITRARTMLAWEPRVQLGPGLARTMAWAQAQTSASRS